MLYFKNNKMHKTLIHYLIEFIKTKQNYAAYP